MCSKFLVTRSNCGMNKKYEQGHRNISVWPRVRFRSRGHQVAHPDLPFSGLSNLKKPKFCACGRLGRQRDGNVFSPESTEDAEGDQEHHQGGAIAHGVHDLQLHQVLVLQREACVSPTHPVAGLLSASECTCSGSWNLSILTALLIRFRGPQLIDSEHLGFGKDLGDHLMPTQTSTPCVVPLTITLNSSLCLNTSRDIGSPGLLRKSSGIQGCKILGNFFSREAKIYYF